MANELAYTNVLCQQNFTAVNNSGFKIEFSNGWTISVMWGVGNYCSNRREDGDYYEPRGYVEYAARTAEMAAWHVTGANWDFRMDGPIPRGPSDNTYRGWMTPEQVLAAMQTIANHHF
jgi:hypothetical protein